jgi:hypothetical protein
MVQEMTQERWYERDQEMKTTTRCDSSSDTGKLCFPHAHHHHPHPHKLPTTMLLQSSRSCASSAAATQQRRRAFAPAATQHQRPRQQQPIGGARRLVAADAALKDTAAVPVMDKGELSSFPEQPAVYAVLDAAAVVQYVGLTRKVRRV